ncbi:MAG: hemerythrin family protein [Magnetococcales bacterium]|nr:hemerythrin family protein [Magnetococcales bacterium]
MPNRTINWSDALKTSNTKIDEQHQKLFLHFNRFIHARLQGNGMEEALKTLSFLEGYTDEHFSYEEALYKRRMLPGITAHRMEHEKFRANIQQIRLDCRDDCNDEQITRFNNLLGGWFRNHILQEDIRAIVWINDQSDS